MPTQYFDRPVGRLAYSDYGGAGELALMLPGMGALRSEYRFLGPKLVEAGFHAVAVDLRGQGESSVPWKAYDVPAVGSDILEFIEYLDHGPAHVIATSFAAAAAVWAEVECSQCVHSLVLIGPFARVVKINPLMSALFWLVMNNPWRVRMWETFYRRMYPTRKPADFEDYMAQLMKNMAEPGRFDAVKGFGDASRVPSEQRLSRVQAPVLVVMGTKDPDFPDPAAEAKFLAEQTRGRVAMIEGAGHYPQSEMPEETASAVIEFIQ